jgi:hypothetical protein
MNFSFVLPVRGDREPVIKMLDSFERTTKWKKDIEFLIAIDEGKTDIVGEVEKEDYSFPIMFFERPKTKDFTNTYYNWLATRTTGKIIAAFNDDAWMRTDEWDKKILRTVSSWGITTYCLDVPDTARIKYKNQFPCFPFVSRRAMCSLGFLLIPEVKMYPADKVTFGIYEHSQRVIQIRDVMIEHEHSMDYTGEKKFMMDCFTEDYDKVKEIDLSQHIYKLLLVSQSDALRKPKLVKILEAIKS